jgi:hypothetical protein
MRCSDSERFIVKMTMWFDVLGSITQFQHPVFMTEYRSMFGRSTMSVDPPQQELSMINVMGCESHIVWVLAEISGLAAWKQKERRQGSLSTKAVNRRGRKLEDHLCRSSHTSALDPMHFYTSEVFRLSTRVYLNTVVSDDGPDGSGIKDAIQETVSVLKKVRACDSHVYRLVVQYVPFPIFMCACLTEDENDRLFLISLLSEQYSHVSGGNCWKVLSLVESIRKQQDISPIRWREALRDAELLLL